mgnify:CR=1 FL=1
MGSSTSTPSKTPKGNNDASKTTRKAKIIYHIIAAALIVVSVICVCQLCLVHSKLKQTKEQIETLTKASGPRCYFIDENNVRLMTVEAAQKEFDAYIDSQSNLLTIFTILITVMVALLGVGAPIFINREQGKANKEKIGEEMKKQKKDLETKFKKATDRQIKKATKQIKETEKKTMDDVEKKGEEIETAKARIDEMEKKIAGILTDVGKMQENYLALQTIKQETDDDKRIAGYEDLVTKGRASSDTYYELGRLYFEKKQYTTASENFAKAVENRENYAEVYPFWADALEAQGQLAKAWEKREKAIMLNPNEKDLNKRDSLQERILTPASSLPETETIEIDEVKFDMKLVRKGIFTMGATPEQGSDASDDEKPAHQVIVSNYYIGETVVTQALWKVVMGNNPLHSEKDKDPSHFKGDNRPVECVSWKDVTLKFIPELNRMTGRKFRLPTEAEWEFAARGGNNSKNYKFSGGNGIDDVAWYNANSNGETHPVKGKKPNELGLYDMSGNVWEWCQDLFGNFSSDSRVDPIVWGLGKSHVSRGGCWGSNTKRCRVASRNVGGVDSPYYNLGFRLVLDVCLPQEEEKKA